MTAVEDLLGGIVDYAGLFPPAALSLTDAIREYAAYRDGPDAWMLGRLVIPMALLPRIDAEIDGAGAVRAAEQRRWPLSVVAGGAAVGDGSVADILRQPLRYARVDVYESTVAGPDELHALRDSLPDSIAMAAELSMADIPDATLAAAAERGVMVKLRTGGTSPELFPTSDRLIDAMRRCIDRRLPFKLTAGLHHAVRGSFPTTYERDALCAVMFGYLNVFVAAAMLVNGADTGDAHAALVESDPSAFVLDAAAVGWRGHRLTADQVRDARSIARSFGSCSFREPVDELHALMAAR